MKKKKVFIIGEFPVLHRGYATFFNKKTKKTRQSDFFIGILGKELIKKLTEFEPDIRSLSAADLKLILNSYLSPERYFILKENNFNAILKKVKPDEISILLGEKSEDFYNQYLDKFPKEIIKFYDIRLRWSSENVYIARKQGQNTFSKEAEIYKRFLKEAILESKKSKCWWRQIGAVLAIKDKIIFRAHNRMLPTDDECYKIGCIRDALVPGKEPEICSAVHAEADILAQAAKQGISVKNAILCVTHFPCPACAKLIALSGIRKIIYSSGSSVFDGERVMLQAGVEIIKLDS